MAPRAMRGMARANFRCILVVDDDTGMREMLGELLRLAGYETVLAADGIEALALARRVRPGALTLDLAMPRLDGNDVLRELGRSSATARIPVVVVSADADGLVRTAQVVEVLEKPFHVGRFLAAIEEAVRGGIPQSAAIPA
jgi:CheY-like chemotaxis protein